MSVTFGLPLGAARRNACWLRPSMNLVTSSARSLRTATCACNACRKPHPIRYLTRCILPSQFGEAGAAAGDRFGCTVLSQLLERIKDAKAKGTTTVAFLTQQWTGGRGLNRLLEETKPDEMIFVGRMATGGKSVARAGTAALT